MLFNYQDNYVNKHQNFYLLTHCYSESRGKTTNSYDMLIIVIYGQTHSLRCINIDNLILFTVDLQECFGN